MLKWFGWFFFYYTRESHGWDETMTSWKARQMAFEQHFTQINSVERKNVTFPKTSAACQTRSTLQLNRIECCSSSKNDWIYRKNFFCFLNRRIFRAGEFFSERKKFFFWTEEFFFQAEEFFFLKAKTSLCHIQESGKTGMKKQSVFSQFYSFS